MEIWINSSSYNKIIDISSMEIIKKGSSTGFIEIHIKIDDEKFWLFSLRGISYNSINLKDIGDILIDPKIKDYTNFISSIRKKYVNCELDVSDITDLRDDLILNYKIFYNFCKTGK